MRFRAWLAQNALPLVTETGVKMVSGYLGGGVVGATVNTANTVMKSLSEGYQASIQADIVRGSINTGNNSVASGLQSFYGGRCSISAQYARMIDDYFTVYGYAVKRLKIPNRDSRPHWNYVKTIGCTITGSIPSDDMQLICSIYDNGITFWKNGSEIGDYSLDNSPQGGLINGKQKKRKTLFGESATVNNLTYMQYLNRLTELSVSMFEWKNLPPTVDARYLELHLFETGSMVYFDDDVIGNLCLDCLPSGRLDVYGNPVLRRAYSGYNNYQKLLKKSNSVIIWNNYLHTNSILEVKMFARRLYNLDRIIDVNANAQKTPVLIQGTEQQRLTLKNLYKEFDGNSPFIFW